MSDKEIDVGLKKFDKIIVSEGRSIAVEYQSVNKTQPETLIALREEIGMNRKQFAERFGIPYRTITDWERGERQMPDYVLRLLTYAVKMAAMYEKEDGGKLGDKSGDE